MHPCRIISTLLCALSLLASGLGSAQSSSVSLSGAADSKQAIAVWLSQQLHQPVEVSQILVSPAITSLAGCTVTHIRSAQHAATSLSLHCPAHVLPQLVLLKLSLAPLSTPAATSIVRAGDALRADWRTDSMHAELDVVAMDAGAVGAEIRVRIAHSNRILRAHILSARSVRIVANTV